jgi:hypothetical protein
MALANSAYIVVAIICCGALICCLAAVDWVYRRGDLDLRGVIHGWWPSDTPADYMREVRERNQRDMLHGMKYHERTLS